MPASSIMQNPFVAIGLFFLVVLGGLYAGAPILARFMLFQPPAGDPGTPPALAGVAGEELRIETDDGVRIQGWWYEATPDSGAAPAVLLLHGNAGSIAGRVGLARGLLERGISVLALGYRGYGASEGHPSPRGIGLDAAAGIGFLVERTGRPSRVVVHGRSLGGVAALEALGSGAPAPAGLVLESAFSSLSDIGRSVYPFLPGPVFRRLRGMLDARRNLSEWDGPVLIVHGADDRIVPAEMARVLHAAARDPRGLWIVEGAGHNDLEWVAGPKHVERIARFVRTVVGDDLSDED